MLKEEKLIELEKIKIEEKEQLDLEREKRLNSAKEKKRLLLEKIKNKNIEQGVFVPISEKWIENKKKIVEKI